ncbi:DEAD/DEAH box helicase [Paratractidigestivibacter sp.]|uniref:DEAD/DEAH box helicase n=1 Tax=Paratractidigestivibacter sp. TaxID=2847316 RepID=UPI002ACB0FE5|nr:DEAD/DEAH box helicase [Paratractidigestivibacter sp.]
MASKQLVTSLKREAALSSTFDTGKRLACNFAVFDVSRREGSIGSTVRIGGKVDASHGGFYNVTVDLDLAGDEVLDYTCTCPAAYSYRGMCKHEIALALAFMGPYEDGEVAGRYAAPAPRKAPELPTSSSISGLLRGAADRRLRDATERRARVLAPEPAVAEKARLSAAFVTPARTADAGCLALKLTVHRGTTKYIVKNVADLVSAWRAGATMDFGKKLRFACARAAFDERSCALLDLLARVVDTQQAFYLSRWDYADGGRGTEVKELPLSPADICEVLDLMQGSCVQLGVDEGSGYDRWGYRVSKKKAREFAVGVGEPAIECEILEAKNGGYDINLPSDLLLIYQGEHCYATYGSRLLRTSEEFAREAAPVFSALLDAYGTAHVSSKDAPEFCRSVLPVLRAWTDVRVPESLASVEPPEPAFSFTIGLDDGELTCEPRVAYGDWAINLGLREGLPGEPARDMAAEYHVMDVLEDYFPLVGGLYVFDEADEELLYRLLTEGLPELSGLGEVLLSERLSGISVRQSPNLSVRATVKSNLLDVELGASGMTQRELLEYLDGWKRKQKYVRLSSGDIVRIGDNLKKADELAAGLGVDVEKLVLGDAGLPSSRSLLIDALLDRADGIRLTRNAGFRAIVRDFDTYADADIEVPAGLNATLRGYQEDGMRWLGTLERFGFGGILADDMGLGKTLQVIAHILAQKEAGALGTTLVVCPASLVYNWVSELERFAPGLDAAAVIGTKTARTALIGGADAHDVLVTSYDLLRRDVETYAKHRFARVVLDEAQYIKNPKAQVTKAVKCLDSEVRLALTGTPIENRLQELWSIFEFLMPGYLGSRDRFAKLYEGPVEAREHGSATLLRCAIGPFVLRRLKSEVLADLPEKTESVVYAQMEAKQRKLYLACQDRLALQIQHAGDQEIKKDKLKVLAELTKLRQVCCDPSLYFEDYDGGSAKLETCMELVAQAIDSGHKVLLFSQFTSMLAIISERLAAEGVSHFQLTGSTSKEERERLVKRFQAGGADVFLISLKAGGVGLNLTAADVVIHYDPWWNTAAQDQATDRAHRIGQRRDVTVFKLIAKDTIEERILQMQESKRGLAESVLSGEEVKSALLTRDDILALLGGN